MSETLIPPNATAEERAQEQATARVGEVPVGINTLWNPDTCPSEFLPWLAWAMSVDEWDANWSEDQKRGSIRDSYGLHVKKGTVGSVRRVLKAAGYGDVVIVEGLDAKLYNGVVNYSGRHFHGQAETHWAMYRVYLHRPISISQAAQVRRMLEQTVPTRCHLTGLHYDETLHLYDNTLSYNGNYSHGVA